MGASLLIFEIILPCLLAAILLHRYGDLRRQHLLVTTATFIAWYFSLMIIFILPLDVALTFYRQCVHDIPLSTSTTVPISVSILHTTSTSGNITLPPNNTFLHHRSILVKDKGLLPPPTRSTLTLPISDKIGDGMGESHRVSCGLPVSYLPENVLPAMWRVIYWTSQILTWLVLPLMQSYSNAGDFTVFGKLKSALIENAIFYGSYLLIFGICLIYVATVQDLNIDGEKLKVICVTASNTWGLFVLVLMLGYGLVELPRSVWNNAKHGHRLSSTYFKIAKLSVEKTEAEESLEDVIEEIQICSRKINRRSPLRDKMDIILSKVMQGMQLQLRTQIQWRNLIAKAFLLEEVGDNMVSQGRRYSSSTAGLTGPVRFVLNPTAEWYWRCLLRAYVLKAVSVMLVLLSVIVVWSECLFFIKSPVLSLFAVFINLARRNYDYNYIELVSVLTIAYLCCCAYYSVFKIRILNYYYIASHHQTNEHSLLFTGMMLCRLTPPLCLNFLGLIHLDSHIARGVDSEETSYTKIMGHMDVIAIISDGFNVYFPILIVLLCICTYFSLGSHFLSVLGFQQFIGDDDMTTDLIEEGVELVRRERRQMERRAEGEHRRKVWTEMFGEGSNISKSSSLGRAVKQSVACSPDSTDRTELLRQVEPIDYTDVRSSGKGDPYPSGSHQQHGYQTQGARFGASRNILTKPPQGIFDDV